MSSLTGRVALVTGVSRRIGIAYEVARRLAAEGAKVLATGWSPHDAEQPWGRDDVDAAELGAVRYRQDDLADSEAPARLVDAAVAEFGGVDLLVAAHARSSSASLAQTTAAELDLCWAVNTRATLLLVQRFAQVCGEGGRVVLFTSGQHLGPLAGELAYAVTKGAVQQVTATLAHELAPAGITVNCINPGPVDTGYADDESRAWIAGRMPLGRWGRPSDTADLIAFLVGPTGGWVNGQTLVSDGGWAIRG